MGRRPERQARWRNTTATGPVAVGERHELQLLRQFGFERIEALGEEMDLGLLGRLFRPHPSTVAWVEDFIAGRSKEGPYKSAASFWDSIPSSRMLRRNWFC